MSPKRCGSSLAGRALAVLTAACLGAGPARAVVGGQEDAGPAARSTLMVLSSRGGMCSAVVVAPDVVLTAAHCAAGPAEHRVHFRDPGGEPVLIVPAASAVHPGYDRGAVAGRRRSIDLALLRLPAPLPARFAPATLAAGSPGKGAALTLGGYGVSREGDGRSTGTFRTAALALVEPHGPSRILAWAADPQGRGAGACEGDSGGPILDGSGALVAVTSWAAGSGRRGCGAMSQGVLVGPQRGWITQVLAGWSREATWR